MPFQPRRAIVTASDSGIGRATAVPLAGAGMDIGVTWHSDEAGAQDTAAEVREAGVRAEVARLDTSELTGCGNIIDELADRLGGVDVFVNNAGTGSSTLALGMSIQEWRRVVATDLDGAFACIQRAARRMVAAAMAGGSSLSPACTSTSRGPGSAAYDADKHGLGGLMTTLAL